MLEQGIERDEIEVRNDDKGKGNLLQCMESFKDCGEREGGIWHLQDDVIISGDFHKRTKELNNGVVCGFCCQKFESEATRSGDVYPEHMWYSFPCIRIPNRLAKECSEWFFDDASKRRVWAFEVNSKKYDDFFWREFMIERYPTVKVVNLRPSLVDHIDYLIGGSIINTLRKGQGRACYFEDEHLIKKLEEQLKNRGK